MAGMFYSIQETAGKLGITEDEVKQLAKDGKLREFRDGENIMFKIEEVDNLRERESALPLDVLDETGPEINLPTEPLLAEEPESSPIEDDINLDEPLGLTEDDSFDLAEVSSAEESAPKPADDLAQEEEEPLILQEDSPDVAEASGGDLDALLGLSDVEEETPSELPKSDEQVEAVTIDDELDLSGMDDLSVTDEASEIDLLSDTQIVTDESLSGTDEISFADTGESGDEDILLAAEDSVEPRLEESLDDDTAITGEGISVLGKTDGDYQLTDDTMAETLAGLGATGEASLEEIEEDVNLDSFGSGSGLLDLSLQADDTSLGGILDEIYTSDEEEAPAPDTEQATAEAMTAEVDQLSMSDEMPESSLGMAAMPVATVAVAEAEPDASSNILGALLFIPLFLIIYTAIVALYASMTGGQLISLAEMMKGFIWIAMGGLLVVAIVWAIVGFTKAGPGGAKKARGKKAKKTKAKKEKVKKEKAPKEKKAKKSLFGKKK